MEVGTQAMDHLINILQTDRYADTLLVWVLVGNGLFWSQKKSVFATLCLFLYNRSDSEILGYALDTLYNIICNDEEEELGIGLLLLTER